jgi:hypothetical protein
LIFALTSTTDAVRRNTAQPFKLQDQNFVLKSYKTTFFRTETEVIGLIFALTSTTDAVRRNTAQPFKLQDQNFVL